MRIFEKTLGNNRGVALLITLTIIVILLAVTVELNRKVRTHVVSTAMARDRITLTQMAETGIDVARAVLIKDKMEDEANSKLVDSLFEDWADTEIINDALKEIPFASGDVTVTITDELGKIQVNALVRFPKGQELNRDQQILWDRFLGYVLGSENPEDDTSPPAIINSVKDWLDSGDDDLTTGLNGAESDYYEELDSPYSCKNGPFIHLGELYLVKGITPDLLKNIGDNEDLTEILGKFDIGLDDEQLVEQISAVSDAQLTDLGMYMTVYGMTSVEDAAAKEKIEESDGKKFTFPGQININTVDLPVLVAILPSESEDLAPVIYEYRQTDPESESGEIPDLSSLTWYKSAPGCSDVKINEKLITVSSDFFRVTSTAVINEVEMTLTAVVQREKNKKTGKWECRVLSWSEE